MGNQIVVHRPDYEDSKRKKSTTDISLKSIVAKEQAEIDKMRMDYESVSKEIKTASQLSDDLITKEFEKLNKIIDYIYATIKNIYYYNDDALRRDNFSKFEEAAYDYMRQFPDYFEVS